MALPKLETPVYRLTIPSTQTEVKFRPFLVKEEKILLISIQEGKPEVLFDAIKQIISNCTFEQVNVDELTTYDLEYIFLQLRIKSKGAGVPLSFRCENTVKHPESGNEEECGCVNEIEYDLEQVEIKGDTKAKKKIILDEKKQIGIIMKVPTFEDSKALSASVSEDGVESIYSTFARYIDVVFEGEKIYDDFTHKELEEWIEELSDEQFKKIQDFFTKIPKLSAEINVECISCGYKETVTVEGLQNFLE